MIRIPQPSLEDLSWDAYAEASLDHDPRETSKQDILVARASAMGAIVGSPWAGEMYAEIAFAQRRTEDSL